MQNINIYSKEFLSLSKIEQAKLICEGMRKLDPIVYSKVEKTIRNNIKFVHLKAIKNI